MEPETNPQESLPHGSQPPPLVEAPVVLAEVVPPGDTAGRTPPEPLPLRWRELLAVLLIVVLADVTIYRGGGLAGYAAFFLAAPLLLWLGAPRPRYGAGFWLLGVLLLLLAAKMLWCGWWLPTACGFALIVAFAMCLAGLRPYVLETIVFGSQAVLAGYEGLIQYWRSAEQRGPTIRRGVWLEVGLPVAAFVAFGLLFVVANPDLLATFSETLQEVLDSIREWILHAAPTWDEVLFWFAVLWVAVGLLRPVVTRAILREKPAGEPAGPGAAPVHAILYSAFRNTLVTVIVLFAVYLVFEFVTLWGHEFPEGFHYSGYAHEGAAWLTVALALSTAILSLIFRGQVLQDPRQGRLRRLAWIWSLENMLLAVSVCHRLTIYIGFNGMTRMRMVAFFGMACVVAGFILVVWKITHNRDFVWLVRRHLWAVALAVFVYALVPVDIIVHGYNVRRIMAGDPAPSVQISYHPIDSEGVLELLPLVDCDDEIIREGVRAMLARRLDDAEAAASEQGRDWTLYQMADRRLLERLRAASPRWAEFEDLEKRAAARKRFDEYAYERWF